MTSRSRGRVFAGFAGALALCVGGVYWHSSFDDHRGSPSPYSEFSPSDVNARAGEEPDRAVSTSAGAAIGIATREQVRDGSVSAESFEIVTIPTEPQDRDGDSYRALPRQTRVAKLEARVAAALDRAEESGNSGALEEAESALSVLRGESHDDHARARYEELENRYDQLAAEVR